MPGGFQTQVANQPAQAVAGDWASTNPYFTYDAGPGGLVAGVGGVSVGQFAWTYPPVDPNSAPTVAQNFGTGQVTGFVGRALQALNTVFLSDATMLIPIGIMVTLFTGGDFWVVNNGTTTSAIGNKTYANYSNGQASFAATGSPTTGATSTASSIAAATNSFTGSITGDVLTVTAVASGTLTPGTTLTGTLSGTAAVATGTTVLSQISGTTGGIGTYYVSIPLQAAGSQTINGTYGVLTVGGTVTGSFAVGDVLNGSGIAANTAITALGSGTGGAGTYYLNNNTVVAGPEAINAYGTVETKWVAMSVGAPGQLVKISSQPLG
jgi:hypothetical protein